MYVRIIPVDAKLATDRDVAFEAVPLSLVLRSADGAKRLRLMVLDACRTNPFAAQMRGAGTRAIGRGLARIEPVDGDTLVGYAAKLDANGNVTEQGYYEDDTLKTAMQP